MITVFFCSGDSKVSEIIQRASMARWSHVAIAVDGFVYEALMQGGVIKSTASDFARNANPQDSLRIAVPNKIGLVSFLESCVGAGYDWGGLFGYPGRRDWEEPGRWFCSELVAAALIQGGLWSLQQAFGEASRVSPKDLWAFLWGVLHSQERKVEASTP